MSLNKTSMGIKSLKVQAFPSNLIKLFDHGGLSTLEEVYLLLITVISIHGEPRL